MLIILTKSDQDEHYNMNIFLIELKNNINNSDNLRMFKKLVGKISSNMNIMYLFLTLNNHNNPDKGYEGKDIKINFKGIIFYNKAIINGNQDQSPTELTTERDLLKILLENNSQYNPLVIKTFLNDKDKIGIKFFKNPNEDTDEMKISIQDLMT